MPPLPRAWRPLLSLHARCLTTFPRRIPSYIELWHPSQRPPSTMPTEHLSTSDMEIESGRIARKKLRDKHMSELFDQMPNPKTQTFTQRLNQSLWRAPHNRESLWRVYFDFSIEHKTMLRELPDRAWDLIWDAAQEKKYSRKLRRSHLAMFYMDMESIGKRHTVGQRVADLFNTFTQGMEEKALAEWEADHEDKSEYAVHRHKPEHLELGVKMYSLVGNANRARQIMEELFDLYPEWDPGILVYVIRAHTDSTLAVHHEFARTLYTQLKEKLAQRMTLKIYDACFVGFLQIKDLQFATKVFRHMVQDDCLATESQRPQVQETLKRIHLLFHLASDMEKMTTLALQALTILPHKYYSHLFYEWMKLAVVRKTPDAALQILDLMHTQGFVPTATHFNLIIETLLRTQEESRSWKAENIGWHMVELASKAGIAESLEARISAKDITERAIETVEVGEKKKKLPKANVITFALLMQHHAKKQQWQYVEYLIRQSEEANIQPDEILLEVMMDNHSHRGHYRKTWETYKSVTHVAEGKGGVFPNGSSIRCMWRTLRLALGDVTTRHDPELPTPRQLLAETVDWWERCRRRHDADRFLLGVAGPQGDALSKLLVHCFTYTRDLIGSLVGLHVLRNNFGVLPSGQTALMIQRQVAWVDMKNNNNKPDLARANARLDQIYQLLQKRRHTRTGLTKGQLRGMDEKAMGDFHLNLLSEFIRVVLKRSYSPSEIEAKIDQAKMDVGVPMLPTGDLNAFDVI